MQRSQRTTPEKTHCKYCRQTIWRRPRRTLSGRYYVPTGVCEDCVANNRLRKPSKPIYTVDLTEDLHITNNVLSRLQKKSENEFPETLACALPEITAIAILAASIILGIVYGNSDLAKPDSIGVKFLIGLVWIALTLLTLILSTTVLSGPRDKRDQRIELKTIELAQERAERYQERERFYSSPEWRMLREAVIEEDGRRCGDCDKYIRKKIDVTVDHVLPRGKYPEMSLRRDNLRVLCRRCNSKKSDRV